MTGKKEGVRRKKEELILVRRGVGTGGWMGQKEAKLWENG